MGEGFSSVIFLFGIVVVLAVGKACTRLIWRTLPKPGPHVRACAGSHGFASNPADRQPIRPTALQLQPLTAPTMRWGEAAVSFGQWVNLFSAP
jgi:hypothetical protein